MMEREEEEEEKEHQSFIASFIFGDGAKEEEIVHKLRLAVGNEIIGH